MGHVKACPPEPSYGIEPVGRIEFFSFLKILFFFFFKQQSLVGYLFYLF